MAYRATIWGIYSSAAKFGLVRISAMHNIDDTIYLHLPLPPELDEKRFVLTDWDDGLNIYLIDDKAKVAETHRSCSLNLIEIFRWQKNNSKRVQSFQAKIPENMLATTLVSPVFQLGVLKAMRELGDISHLANYPILLAMIGEAFDKGEPMMSAMQVRSLLPGEMAQHLFMLKESVDAQELTAGVAVGDMLSYFDVKNRIIADYS